MRLLTKRGVTRLFFGNLLHDGFYKRAAAPGPYARRIDAGEYFSAVSPRLTVEAFFKSLAADACHVMRGIRHDKIFRPFVRSCGGRNY